MSEPGCILFPCLRPSVYFTSCPLTVSALKSGSSGSSAPSSRSTLSQARARRAPAEVLPGPRSSSRRRANGGYSQRRGGRRAAGPRRGALAPGEGPQCPPRLHGSKAEGGVRGVPCPAGIPRTLGHANRTRLRRSSKPARHMSCAGRTPPHRRIDAPVTTPRRTCRPLADLEGTAGRSRVAVRPATASDTSTDSTNTPCTERCRTVAPTGLRPGDFWAPSTRGTERSAVTLCARPQEVGQSPSCDVVSTRGWESHACRKTRCTREREAPPSARDLPAKRVGWFR